MVTECDTLLYIHVLNNKYTYHVLPILVAISNWNDHWIVQQIAFPTFSTWAPAHNAATSRLWRSPHRHARHTHGWDLWGAPHRGGPCGAVALNQTEKAMPEAPAQDEESDIAPVGMCLALRQTSGPQSWSFHIVRRIWMPTMNEHGEIKDLWLVYISMMSGEDFPKFQGRCVPS